MLKYYPLVLAAVTPALIATGFVWLLRVRRTVTRPALVPLVAFLAAWLAGFLWLVLCVWLPNLLFWPYLGGSVSTRALLTTLCAYAGARVVFDRMNGPGSPRE